MLKRLAATLSLVFLPMFTGTYVLLVLSLAGTTSLLSATWWFLVTAGLSTIVPTVDLLRRINARSVSDIQIAAREERMRPLLVSLVCTAGAMAIVWLAGGPEALRIGLAAALITGAVMTLVTTRWKISFHAGTGAGAVVLFMWQLGPLAALLLTLLAAVCWARVYLRRHSVAQVVGGVLVGAILTEMTIRFMT